MRVHDRVAVALLREEALPVLRVVLVDGVARDERVEARGVAGLLRPQQPAQALRLLLAGAEGSGDLDRDRRSGRSIEKFATFDTTSSSISPSRNCRYSSSRSSTGVAPVMDGASSAADSSSSWSRYCPITRIRSPACFAMSSRTAVILAGAVATRR